ncbi:MAG: hypothetical protein K6C97_01165 [Treponema sp.]|nr:hypothetical protein [Treponema sp.]
MKLNKKAALILGAFVLATPMTFAESSLAQEITALELELTKMTTKVGEYADMSDAKLEKLKTKTKKTLDKKKKKAKKELEKNAKKAKDSLKDAGDSLKETGKDIGNAFKGIFD